MRKTLLYWGVAAFAAILATAGCGGGDGDNTPAVTTESRARLVAAYVWVSGNEGTSTPPVIVTNSSVAPNGYFAPTAGTITLSVANGSITRAPDTESFNLATSNAIIANVVHTQDQGAVTPFQFSVTGSGIERSGVAKAWTFGTQSINLGTANQNGTTLTFTLGTPTINPGPPARIETLVRDRGGNPGTSDNPFEDPDTATGGNFISGTSYDVAIAVYDEDGTLISGIAPTIASSDVTRVTTTNSPLRFTPVAGTGVTAGPVTLTVSLPSNTLQSAFSGSFGYGTVTTVNVTTTDGQLTWFTLVATDSEALSVAVLNQYGTGIPNANITLSTQYAPSNTWQAPAAGTAFVSTGLTTNNAGTASGTLNGPAAAPGDPVNIANNPPKGANTIVATVGSVTGNAVVTIVRPLGSLVLAGPSRLDVGTTSSSDPLSSQAYRITGGADVDGVAVATPAGPFTWTRTNVAGAGTVGDADDVTPQSTAASALVGSPTGTLAQLTAGNAAGRATVSVAQGLITSNTITTDIHGAPAKLIYRLVPGGAPATTSQGFTGVIGAVISFEVSFIDSWGRVVPLDELTLNTKAGTTDSNSGANIVFPPLQDRTYTLTLGSGNGTASTTFTGTWTGTQGGSSAWNIQRSAPITLP